MYEALAKKHNVCWQSTNAFWHLHDTYQSRYGARRLAGPEGKNPYRQYLLSQGFGIRPRKAEGETATETPLPCGIGG